MRNLGQTTVSDNLRFACNSHKVFAMPRRPRLSLPNTPLHIIQRGNNRQACFYADEDYRFYLDWLVEHAAKTGCQVHAYVLMTNHVHLLISAPSADAPGALMKAQGQRYVQYVNRTYRRSGTLWEGRYRSCLTQDETYLLACQRYIELNPVRAEMVAHPAEYRWSSYRANAQGEPDGLVTPHMLFEALGPTAEMQQAAYRELFGCALEPGLVDEIRRATNGNFALGNGRFAGEVATVLGRRATPGKGGRPRKVQTHESLVLATE
jgi:putative transposase